MATPELRTPAGRELQFATNHLGHFALTVGLRDALAAAGGTRVVVLSSVGHVNGPVRFHDPDFTKEPYDPWPAYAQSKTVNILFAVEAAQRWAADGIAVNALNPGRIWETGLGRHMDTPPVSFDPAGTSGVSEKNIAQGAATSVCWQRLPSSTVSPAGISRTARKPDPAPSGYAAVSPPTPSTPAVPASSGTCRWMVALAPATCAIGLTGRSRPHEDVCLAGSLPK